jgi:sugar O-acyltransferase (sialic acid O-acetyltransferase NeuD family)
MKHPAALVLLGAGGLAAEIIEAAEQAGWKTIRLYDDRPAMLDSEVMGYKCLGSIDQFEREASAEYLIAIGQNEVRQKLEDRMSAAGHSPASVIHPGATVSRAAQVAPGAYIGAGAFIGPHSRIGSHAIINVGTTVGHNAVLGRWVQVCPGARVSGFAALGDGVFIGSNAVVSPGITLGDWAKLGAASFAARNIPAGTLAVGVPARLVTD